MLEELGRDDYADVSMEMYQVADRIYHDAREANQNFFQVFIQDHHAREYLPTDAMHDYYDIYFRHDDERFEAKCQRWI